jgi:hypothetical protein
MAKRLAGPVARLVHGRDRDPERSIRRDFFGIPPVHAIFLEGSGALLQNGLGAVGVPAEAFGTDLAITDHEGAGVSALLVDRL